MDKFIADGHERAREAIRAEVGAEFAERFASASSLWQRLQVHLAFRAELKKRLRAKAPGRAFYARN